MPQQKRYSTNAARQAAYRKRRETTHLKQQQEKGLPPLPVVPSLPGSARWKAALTQAAQWLSVTCAEMLDYQAARSERWQESERGEAFAERLDELTQLTEQLETLL